MTSGIKALVRATAKKNGHNPDVIEAMIDKTKELRIGDTVLNKEGQILTLTNDEAEKTYGDPPQPLLSAGTVENLDALLEQLGFANAIRKEVKPTGAEQLATWISVISPILLMIGVVGIYIEFKTPGFGLPGIVGIAAFALYFFGSYVAGLAGLEWLALFIVGVALVAVELFVLPGTVFVGVAGAALMLVAVIMATADLYPGMPTLPSPGQLKMPFQELGIAFAGSVLAVWLLSLWLPRTSVYGKLVSQGASGVSSVDLQLEEQESRLGEVGVTVSMLRPGGKARFGDDVLDVITQGEFLAKGQRVRIIGHSARESIVEAVNRG